MRKFLLKILFFIVPLVVAAYLFDGMLTLLIRKSETGDIKVWEEIFEGKINADVVIYGSSRAQYHFDPAILEDSLHMSAYNLGITGHSYLMAKCRQDILLRHNKPPRVMICSFDFLSFDKRYDLWGYKNFAPFLDDTTIRRNTKQYDGFDLYDYSLPLVRYIGHKKEIQSALVYAVNKKHAKDQFYKGYSPVKEGWNGDFEKAKATLKQLKVNISQNTLTVFEEFIRDALDKKIKIIFVYSPEYYESRSFVENRDALFDQVNKYAKEYSIPFLDYSNDTLCNSKKYFNDAEHLNVYGATLFSAKLAHDIKGIIER